MNTARVSGLGFKIRKIIQARLDAEDSRAYGDPLDLGGACGYASYALWKNLPGSTLVEGRFDSFTHCWVEYEGKIIDLTATQFDNYPEVFIVALDSSEAKHYRGERRNRRASVSIADWYPSGWRLELKKLLREGGVSSLVEEERV